ncbi:Ig-like domain-containing protein [Thermophagus sp. OGC60D27]|uniref:Ig-like domain-containing protein n=1 Tax=Thermophagus sp. OGC60D27 TaxID=3458415 RepID=UPI004037E176
MNKYLPYLTIFLLWIGVAGKSYGQAPEIVSMVPDSNATEVALNVALKLVFNENISFNSTNDFKSITISETANSENIVFNAIFKSGKTYNGIPESGNVISITNDTLFFDLSQASLSPETQYSVFIEEGAIENADDGTAFAGIDDASVRWRFTTVSRPGLSLLSPVNGATDVTGLESLTLTFTEPVGLGDDKNLTIYKEGGSVFQTINTTNDADRITVTGSGYDVNVSHRAFTGNKGFYIDVEEGFVTSQSSGTHSAAIDGATHWSITTAEGPSLSSFSPVNLPESGVNADEPIVLQYNKPITLTPDKEVTIRDDEETLFQTINTTDDADLFSYNSIIYQLTINHDNFPGNTILKITVEEGLVTTQDNQIASDAIDSGWQFTSAEGPKIKSFTPDGINEVAGNRVLELYYSENIVLASNKNIHIYRADDDQLFQTINTSTNSDLLNVTDTTLQIEHDPLWGNTQYYILVDEGLVISSTTSVEAEGITDNSLWRFTTESGPTMEGSSPEANATEVSISAPFEIYFNEEVTTGSSGTITLHLWNDDSVVQTIAFDSENLQISNDTLTILHSNLSPQTKYYIHADQGVILSSNTGTPWDGIQDNTLSFTTGGAPQISAYDPQPEETNAHINNPFTLTFSDNIRVGNSGYLKIRKEGDIFIQDIPYNAGLLTIEANKLLITHDELEPSTTYFIQIENDVVRSLSTDVPFPGISDTSQWRFTTAGPPQIVSLSPTNDGTLTSANENLVITFNEDIEAGTSGSLRIRYANAEEASFQTISIEDTEHIDISDNTLTISNLEFTPDTGYYVTIASGFVKSVAGGVDFDGISDTTRWRFTAPSGPTISTFEPANNSIDIATDSILTLTFNEPIVRGNGNMVIHYQSDGSDALTVTSASSSNLVIEENQISFPNLTLPNDATLYVTIDAGFIKSQTSNFSYGGLSDTTQWVFTTLPSPPAWSNGYPHFDAITPNNLDLALMTGKDATYYFVVTAESTAPSVTQITEGKKSDDSQAAVAGNGSLTANSEFIHQNIDISGFQEGYYWLHVVTKNPEKEIYSEVVSLQIDKLPPVASFYPADGTTHFPENSNMTISFNESIYSSGTLIDNANVSDFVSLTKDGVPVSCSITINTSTNIITIDPDNDLSPIVEYVLSIDPVEDNIGNEQSDNSSITFTTDKQNIWTGTGSDPKDWSDENNWSTGSFSENTSIFVPLAAEPLVADQNYTIYNLTLEAGAVMQHTGGTLTVNGEFRLQSSASVNASYLNSGGTLVVDPDSVKIEQVVTANNINYNLSAPTSGATKTGMGVTNNLYAFTNSTGSYTLIGDNTTLTPGNGYILRSDVGTLTFSGAINLSDITVNLEWSSAGLGWNLVGNPYTGSLDWSQINKTNVADAFWIWQNIDKVYGVYNYELGTGINIDSPIIPSHQAFWIKIPSETRALPASITFSTSGLQANTTSYLKSASIPQRVKIAGSNGSVKDETAIVVHNGSSLNLDHLDSDKMLSGSSEALELYSFVEDQKIAINAIPSFMEAIEIPIGYYAGKAGDYAIELIDQTINNVDSLILFDHTENIEWLLSADHPYHFSVTKKGSNNQRFTIKMTTKDVSTDINPKPVNTQRCHVYANNHNIVIETSDKKNLRYMVTDINGKMLDQGKLASNTVNRIASPNQPGLYIIIISSTDGKEEHKIMINN